MCLGDVEFLAAYAYLWDLYTEEMESQDDVVVVGRKSQIWDGYCFFLATL